MPPVSRILVAAAVVAAALLFATGPPSPTTLPPPGDTTAVRGAFHIHTTRSDGALDRSGAAAAAAAAGLDFAIFTDHGDAAIPPEPPAYLHGVLALDGVEISSNDGHYLALDLPAAPYPLGGDARAVVEDVARLGGFGLAAHPTSPRQELAWSAWDLPIDGLEWLNADSEWRDEGPLRLSRAFLDYLWRPAGALAALFDRPAAALARFDALASSRRIVALAGQDAHGGFGRHEDGTRGRRLHVPSYESAFRTFSIYVQLPAPRSGDPIADGRALMDAIRGGRVFTAIDAVASPAFLEFAASAAGERAEMGENLAPTLGPARFTVRTVPPAGAVVRLLRNGRPVAEATGGALEHTSPDPGAYRVEIDAPAAPGSPPVPWLVSNPIFRLPPAPRSAAREPAGRLHPIAFSGGKWRTEASPGTVASVLRDGEGVGLWYRLAPGAARSQFGALVTDLEGPPPDTTHLVLRGRAQAPMRISVQLRFGSDSGRRWRTSVYLDPSGRQIAVPLEALRPADGGEERPAISRATSLLFVVDLTNARPGDEGSFGFTEGGFLRPQ